MFLKDGSGGFRYIAVDIDANYTRILNVITRIHEPSNHLVKKMAKKSSKTLESGYDAIVVGAGIVGSYLARRLAQDGHRVLLLDKRPKKELGGWKNSGHNIDKRVFNDLPIEPPSESEIGASVKYAQFRGPGKTFKFYLPMYNVRLGPFTRRVVDEAVRAGVKFQDRVKCIGVEVKAGKVVGIEAERSGKNVRFRARLVVDVSGIGAVVRNSLPEEFGIEKALTLWDYLNVYAEDHEVDPAHWPVPFTYHTVMQGWSGPRRPGVVGLGLGRFAFTGEDPAAACRELAREALSVPSKVIFKTQARVPVRHPLHKLVAPGVMILGDAAFQGKPLNGEGISVMLYAAEMAAEVAGKALKDKDASEKALWRYCTRYHREWGASFAPFHRLRYELLRFSKAEQRFMMGLGLYGPEEMSSIMLEGKLEMTPERMLNTIRAGWKAVVKPDIVIRLARASIQGEKLKKLYERYPTDPKHLTEWAAQVDSLYNHD